MSGDLGIDLGAEIERVTLRSRIAEVPEPVAGGERGRVVRADLADVGSKSARGDDDGASAQFVVADTDAHHRAAVGEQPIDTLAERDLDVETGRLSTERLDDARPELDREVRARTALLAAIAERGVEGEAEVGEPLDAGPGVVGEPAGEPGIDVPLIHLQVLAQQDLGLVVDALGGLEAGARSHQHPR